MSSIPIATNSEKLKGKQTLCYINYFKDFDSMKNIYFKYYRSKSVKMKIFWDQREAMMLYYGITLFKGITIQDVGTLAFDIETNGFSKDSNSEVFVITNEFSQNGVTETKQFIRDDYENPKQFIKAWCEYVIEKNPTIITGHNIFKFDIPFLIHYASLHKTSLKLGRDDSNIFTPERSSNKRVDGSQTWEFTMILVEIIHLGD